MLTKQLVLNKLNAYLNHEITLTQLVDWSEQILIEPDIQPPSDVDDIVDVLMYLGAADSKGFPLTWEILSLFMHRLGGQVRVVIES